MVLEKIHNTTPTTLLMVFLTVAASRMVDHWISNQRSSPSGSNSPVHSVESSPLPSKKKLTVQTTVSDDEPPKVTHRTLSERYVE